MRLSARTCLGLERSSPRFSQLERYATKPGPTGSPCPAACSSRALAPVRLCHTCGRERTGLAGRPSWRVAGTFTRDRICRFVAAFLCSHACTASRARYRFSSGSLASMQIVSKVNPRKSNTGMGPTTFSMASGMPRKLHTSLMSCKLCPQSANPGPPTVRKSASKCSMNVMPWSIRIHSSRSASMLNRRGAECRPNGRHMSM